MFRLERNWVWRSLVACLNGVQEAESSSLSTQMSESLETIMFQGFLYFCYITYLLCKVFLIAQ